MTPYRIRVAPTPGRRPAALVLAALILCACGQKGPLYLPDEQKQTVKKNTIPSSVPKEDKNRDKDQSKAP